MPYCLKRSDDFALGTAGAERAWARADWAELTHVGGRRPMETRVRALWSERGIYVQFDCVDFCLSGALDRDGADLYTGDVAEIFLQPRRELPVYLEYELSPLDAELPLLVCNSGADFHGWLPFHYEGERRAVHRTRVRGGRKEADAACEGWTAECFLPFALWTGVLERPPESGDVWAGNFFRIDYGAEGADRWAWASACGTEFHDYRKFDRIRLE